MCSVGIGSGFSIGFTLLYSVIVLVISLLLLLLLLSLLLLLLVSVAVGIAKHLISLYILFVFNWFPCDTTVRVFIIMNIQPCIRVGFT